MKYMEQNRYDSTLYFTEEAAALMLGTVGENNLQYADMLGKLSASHFYLGNFTKARYYILKEVELREALKATNDAGYVTSLENASIICRKSGHYEEALIQIKKAEEITAASETAPSLPTQKISAMEKAVSKNMVATVGPAR